MSPQRINPKYESHKKSEMHLDRFQQNIQGHHFDWKVITIFLELYYFVVMLMCTKDPM